MDIPHLERKKVYDVLLRLLHAFIGLSTLALLLTAWSSELFSEGLEEDVIWRLHFLLGYGLIVALALRLAWGVIGPRHARFSDMWHPRTWVKAVSRLEWKAPLHFGHHPMAGAAYLLFYGVLLGVAVSGLGLAGQEYHLFPLAGRVMPLEWLEEGLGEGLEEGHEIGANLLLVFVGVHLAALIWHEKQERIPLAQSMLSGYQYRPLETGACPATAQPSHSSEELTGPEAATGEEGQGRSKEIEP